MKNLLPISDIQQSENLELLYLPGNPRSYRLDLSKGALNLEGREQVTKPGEAFLVIPVAFRCLVDGLFGQPRKKWCEVYFVNREGHLSVFMFHGFSVQNLSEASRDLFYERKNLCEVRWNVRLDKKTNKEGAPYFMAFFEFEPLGPADLERHRALVAEILDQHFHIFRSDTMDAKTLFSENYSTSLEPTPVEIEAEKDRRSALLAEFPVNAAQRQSAA